MISAIFVTKDFDLNLQSNYRYLKFRIIRMRLNIFLLNEKKKRKLNGTCSSEVVPKKSIKINKNFSFFNHKDSQATFGNRNTLVYSKFLSIKEDNNNEHE